MKIAAIDQQIRADFETNYQDCLQVYYASKRSYSPPKVHRFDLAYLNLKSY